MRFTITALTFLASSGKSSGIDPKNTIDLYLRGVLLRDHFFAGGDSWSHPKRGHRTIRGRKEGKRFAFRYSSNRLVNPRETVSDDKPTVEFCLVDTGILGDGATCSSRGKTCFPLSHFVSTDEDIEVDPEEKDFIEEYGVCLDYSDSFEYSWQYDDYHPSSTYTSTENYQDFDRRELEFEDTDICDKYGRPLVNVSGDDFKYLIRDCYNETNGYCPEAYKYGSINIPMNCWNTEKVTDMSSAFEYRYYFNSPVESWNTERVTTMYAMFRNAFHFNQPLGSWKTGKVKDMTYMLYGCYVFNTSVEAWDVGKVTSMEGMFGSTYLFNAPLETWNTGNVKNMYGMFDNSGFGQSIPKWDTAKVTSMSDMFAENPYFNSPIEAWDVSKVLSMSFMFSYGAFNQSIEGWDLGRTTDTSYMFYRNRFFNQPIDAWNVSKVIDMSYMFADATSFNQCLGTWASNTTKRLLLNMFQGSGCPFGEDSPEPSIGPWCQGPEDNCFGPNVPETEDPLMEIGETPSESPVQDDPIAIEFNERNQPTGVPSTRPSFLPSNTPTQIPSSRPSILSSANPTEKPTKKSKKIEKKKKTDKGTTKKKKEKSN